MTAKQRTAQGMMTERWIGSIGGGALLAWGIRQRSVLGTGLAILGGGLVASAVLGRGILINLGRNQSKRSTQAKLATDGVKVEQAVSINRSPEDLYSFWRNFENLPQFMHHLEAVDMLDNQRSHWVAKAPAGTTVAWDAVVTEDRPNELIAWRSLPGADVDNGGSVRFKRLPEGRGTEVHITFDYVPPAGALGAAIAKVFGEEPKQQVEGDLRRFKNVMEAGEIPTNEGQATGERSLVGKLLSPNS